MNNDKKHGISAMDIFVVLLAIVFITLKLCNIIAWSWLWVLSPIWIPIAIALATVLIYAIVVVIAGIVKGIKES